MTGSGEEKQKRGRAHFAAQVETYLKPVFDDPAGSEVRPSMRGYLDTFGGSMNTLKKYGLDKRFEEAQAAVRRARENHSGSRKDERIRELKERVQELEAERDAAWAQVASLCHAMHREAKTVDIVKALKSTIPKPDRSQPAKSKGSSSRRLDDLMEIYGG